MISGVELAQAIPGVEVFHAGTSALTDGEYFTAGGRVLGVTATGDDLASALVTAYDAAAKIKTSKDLSELSSLGDGTIPEPPQAAKDRLQKVAEKNKDCIDADVDFQ